MSLRSQGLIFPLELVDGKPSITEGESLIRSSIAIILSWPIFTREYIDDFGSRINEALEQPNDNVLITLLQNFVIDSISKYEQRIELKSMKFTRHSYSKLTADITYRIKELNLEDSVEKTFYIT